MSCSGWTFAIAFLPLEVATLVINVSWFGAATFFFAVMPGAAMDWLVPRSRCADDLYRKVKGATMFLGGMNSAMAVLSGLVLQAHYNGGLFERGAERRVLFAAIAVGHFSQFFVNLPSFLLKYGLIPAKLLARLLHLYGMVPADVVWTSPDQTMQFIFIVDFLAFALNFYCALAAQDVVTQRI